MTLVAPKAEKGGGKQKTWETIKVDIVDVPAQYDHKPATQPKGTPVEHQTTPTGQPANTGNTGDAELVHTALAAPEHKAKKTFVIVPETAMPEWVTAAHPPLVDGRWAFKEGSSLHPYWAVRRLPASGLALLNGKTLKAGGVAKTFNLKYVDVSNYVTVSGTIGTTGLNDGRKCTCKAITNYKHIIKGTELILRVAETDRDGNKRKATPDLDCETEQPNGTGATGNKCHKISQLT